MTAPVHAAGTPVLLQGGPYARGRQQAERCPDMVRAVRAAVDDRLGQIADRLAAPGTRAWIDAQQAYTARHDPAVLQEIAGIADGFGLGARQVFDYLHASLVADPHAAAVEGCTVLAATMERGGTVVAKNRDYRAEHVAIQRVFHHLDPAWNGREMICVGSLGSPGNFSSGINSDGLAVADTHVSTTDHGVGMHRFFLLTRLLVDCRTVADAVARIRATTHAGGGVVVLGDATGAAAAVELGHRGLSIEETPAGRLGRTNHFVGETTAAGNAAADQRDGRRNSIARLARLRTALARPAPLGPADAAAILASHAQDGTPALCRHGGDDLSNTISTHVHDTHERALFYSGDHPCRGGWHRFGFAAAPAFAGANP